MFGWLYNFCFFCLSLYVYCRPAILVSRLIFVESGLSSVYGVGGYVVVLPSCRASRVLHPYCRLCGGCRAMCASWGGALRGVCGCGRFLLEFLTGRIVWNLMHYICISVARWQVPLGWHCSSSAGVEQHRSSWGGGVVCVVFCIFEVVRWVGGGGCAH